LSTTFEVLPGTKVIPSYEEIIKLADLNINNFLTNIGINKIINLKVNIQKVLTHERKNFSITDKLICDEEFYSWFYIENVPGGTDCYYYINTSFHKEIWEDELRTNPNAQKNKNKIDEFLSAGYHWSFRRSAGQPGIIALSYGMLAASLADLTNGLIFTDDGAWDYSLFPAFANEFISWYFQPELTKDVDCKDFAIQCIKSLSDELK